MPEKKSDIRLEFPSQFHTMRRVKNELLPSKNLIKTQLPGKASHHFVKDVNVSEISESFLQKMIYQNQVVMNFLFKIYI